MFILNFDRKDKRGQSKGREYIPLSIELQQQSCHQRTIGIP